MFARVQFGLINYIITQVQAIGLNCVTNLDILIRLVSKSRECFLLIKYLILVR